MVRELGLEEEIELASLAKQFEEVYRPGLARPGPPAAGVRRALPPAAGARRGAPLRHHLPPGAAGQADDQEHPRRHPRPRARPARPAWSRSSGGVNAVRAASLEELLSLVLAARRPVGLAVYEGVRKAGRTMSEFARGDRDVGRRPVDGAAALEDVGWFVIDNLPAGAHHEDGRDGRPAGVGDRAGGPGHRARRQRHRARSTSTTCPTCWTSCAATRQAGACALPRCRRRGAGAALRGHPAPPPAGGARGRGVDRRRARLLEPVREPGRPPHRHRRAQLQPAAGPHPRGVRRRARRRTCRPRSSRSATSTASRSTSTWSSTAGSCPTRSGWRSCGPFSGLDEPVRDYVLGQPESPGVPGEGGRPADQHPARPSCARGSPT